MIPDNIPYTTTLSLLRKIDLMRLSLEFRLSTEGSVVVLRNRLKAYLNAHRDTLYHNPRYNVLFPKLRRLNPPPNSPQLSFYAPSNQSPSPSPTPSHSSHSSTSSFSSWGGIDYQDRPPSPVQPHHPQIAAPQVAEPDFQPPHFLPPPSPAPLDLGSPPPIANAVPGRELFLLLVLHISTFVFMACPIEAPPYFFYALSRRFLSPLWPYDALISLLATIGSTSP